MLCDLPALRDADLATLIHATRDHPDSLIWRGTTQSGKAGHPIVFAASLFAALMALTGDDGARQIIRTLPRDRITPVRLTDDHALLDLDTPEDWAAWRARRY